MHFNKFTVGITMTIATHPHPLLDTLLVQLDVPTDALLGRKLGIPAPTLSKIRRRHIGVSPFLILKVHELSGLPVPVIRNLLAQSERTPAVVNTEDWCVQA
jgi:hypothetical protein